MFRKSWHLASKEKFSFHFLYHHVPISTETMKYCWFSIFHTPSLCSWIYVFWCSYQMVFQIRGYDFDLLSGKSLYGLLYKGQMELDSGIALPIIQGNFTLALHSKYQKLGYWGCSLPSSCWQFRDPIMILTALSSFENPARNANWVWLRVLLGCPQNK